MFGSAKYRNYRYGADDHVAVVHTAHLPSSVVKFICGAIEASSHNGQFNYSRNFYPKDADSLMVRLPTMGGAIDFVWMEEFIAELEAAHLAELEAYLQVAGLEDYVLTDDEVQALANFDNLVWKEFLLEELFGESTRGKRLKSLDRVGGELPFVTAGESNNGISGFIGNDVTVFSSNTVTIDMFGSAKYRSYKYGADDHVAVVHTDQLPEGIAKFVCAAIEASSHNGQFNYSRNFYAKDADSLVVKLPISGGGSDMNWSDDGLRSSLGYIEDLVSAVTKLVIKDVVDYAKSKSDATRQVVEG